MTFELKNIKLEKLIGDNLSNVYNFVIVYNDSKNNKKKLTFSQVKKNDLLNMQYINYIHSVTYQKIKKKNKKRKIKDFNITSTVTDYLGLTDRVKYISDYTSFNIESNLTYDDFTLNFNNFNLLKELKQNNKSIFYNNIYISGNKKNKPEISLNFDKMETEIINKTNLYSLHNTVGKSTIGTLVFNKSQILSTMDENSLLNKYSSNMGFIKKTYGKFILFKESIKKEWYNWLSNHDIARLKLKYYTENTIVIGIYANISLSNYPNSLLEAIKKLRQDDFNIELLILGNLDSNLPENLNNYKWVKILAIPPIKVFNYLRFCDILVSTTRDYSNNIESNIIIKAYLMCNKPIICSWSKEKEKVLGTYYYGFYKCDTCDSVPSYNDSKDYFKKTNKYSNYFNRKAKEVNYILFLIKKIVTMEPYGMKNLMKNINSFLKPQYNITFNKNFNLPIQLRKIENNPTKQSITHHHNSCDDAKLIITTCVYKRHKLLRLCLEYYSKIKLHKFIAVYSEKDDLKILQEYKFVTPVYNSNYPISRKWNRAITECKKYNPDLVLITGSDDFISKEYIDMIKYKIVHERYDFIGMRAWMNFYFSSYLSIFCKTSYSDRTDPLGAGRCFSKKFLDKLNWNLYDFNLNKRLDCNSYNSFSHLLNSKNTYYSFNYYDILLLKDIQSIDSITYSDKESIFFFINQFYNTYYLHKTSSCIQDIFYISKNSVNIFTNDEEDYIKNLNKYFFN